ncbi:MAG: PAS domain-containing protein, partial [Herbiconiux sp.]|nr:PAS domain-containing protein [Herbiconiux sp.]
MIEVAWEVQACHLALGGVDEARPYGSCCGFFHTSIVNYLWCIGNAGTQSGLGVVPRSRVGRAAPSLFTRIRGMLAVLPVRQGIDPDRRGLMRTELAEHHLDDLCRAAATVLGSSMAAVAFHAADGVRIEGRHGARPGFEQAVGAVCGRVLVTGVPLEVPDTLADVPPATAPDHLVGPSIRSYAAVPLVVGGGHVLGTLCVLDPDPRCYDAPKLDVLGLLGRQAVALLGLRQSRTEAVERADRLSAASRQFEALLGSSPAPIYVKDHEGRFLVANQALHDLVGQEPGTMLARLDADFFPPGMAAEYHRNDAEVMAKGTARTFEESAPNRDGTQRHFVSTKFPLRHPGTDHVHVGGISLDTTALVAVQAQLLVTQQRALLQSAPGPVVLVDAEGAVEFLNAHAVRTFGYAADELVGRPLTRLIPAGLPARTDADTTGPPDGTEALARCRDGREIAVEISLSETLSPSGLSRVIGMRDLSRARILQAELERAREQFRNVLNGARGQAIVVTDLAGRITL